MSANLDLGRSIYANWGRGDYRSVDWANPEMEYKLADGPSPGTWTGIEGMTEGFREVLPPPAHAQPCPRKSLTRATSPEKTTITPKLAPETALTNPPPS